MDADRGVKELNPGKEDDGVPSEPVFAVDGPPALRVVLENPGDIAAEAMDLCKLFRGFLSESEDYLALLVESANMKEFKREISIHFFRKCTVHDHLKLHHLKLHHFRIRHNASH